MDLDDVFKLMDDTNSIANLITLKSSKAWCFMLYGSIQSKLSTARRAVYDIKQILVQTPSVATEILRTLGVILERHFNHVPVPETYSDFDSIVSVIEEIKSMPCDSPESAVQIIYLCIGIVSDYMLLYCGTKQFNDDDELLLTGLLYIIYDALVRISKYSGIECPEREVCIYFNECDIK